jgi:hypothetical protein
MMVVTEMCVGATQRAVLAGSIEHWLPPHEDELISDHKKREILHKVVRFWEHLGKTVVIEDRQPWCPP